MEAVLIILKLRVLSFTETSSSQMVDEFIRTKICMLEISFMLVDMWLLSVAQLTILSLNSFIMAYPFMQHG